MLREPSTTNSTRVARGVVAAIGGASTVATVAIQPSPRASRCVHRSGSGRVNASPASSSTSRVSIVNPAVPWAPTGRPSTRSVSIVVPGPALARIRPRHTPADASRPGR